MTTPFRSLLGMAALAAVLAAACDDNPSSPTVLRNQATSTPDSGNQGACTRPPAPANLRVTAKDRTTVELTWDAVRDANSYTLLVGSIPGGTDVFNQNIFNTSTRFTAPDGKSYARVQAESFCGAGPTGPSIEFSIP